MPGLLVQGRYSFAGEGLGGADAVAAGLAEVGVVHEPVDGGEGEGFGHELVESAYSPCETLYRHTAGTAYTVDLHKQYRPTAWCTAPSLPASGWRKGPLAWVFTDGRCWVRTNVDTPWR